MRTGKVRGMKLWPTSGWDGGHFRDRDDHDFICDHLCGFTVNVFRYLQRNPKSPGPSAMFSNPWMSDVLLGGTQRRS